MRPPAASGAPIAPASVGAHRWLAAFEGRSPLILAPSSDRGWFGGRTLVAADPGFVGRAPVDEAIDLAGAALDAALHGRDDSIAVALLPYDGEACWAVYTRGLVLTAGGWCPWGAWDEAMLPVPEPEDGGCESSDDAVRDVRGDLDEPGYRAAADAVIERIRSGDVYVLNLTRRVSGVATGPPARLFERFLGAAAATMGAAWLPSGGSGIVSASPERFVRVRDGIAEIAPVKGTRPRGASAAADRALVAELTGSEKERAEHVMIVDLERNDLGRVCAPGTIEVDPLFECETTAYCHQMVSTVRGRLEPGTSTADLLRAVFPCGSVTGAPKIAARRIIASLEAGPRGAYTGSLVVAVPGELDSSVLIRTAELHGGRVTYGTGCGVTVDSDPREEWAESVLKTAPLLGEVPVTALRETCRVVAGSVPLWSWHRARLASGGCGEALLRRVDGEVARAAACWGGPASSRVRLTVDVTPDGACSVDVGRRLSSLDVPGGPRLAVVRVDGVPGLPRGAAKPADRTWWDEAHRRAHAEGGDQALITDGDGSIVDGSTATVWLVEGGELVTPPAPPAVAGVARAFVLDTLARAGAPARVEPITVERLDAADEVVLTNAFGGAACPRGRTPAAGFARLDGILRGAWSGELPAS